MQEELPRLLRVAVVDVVVVVISASDQRTLPCDGDGVGSDPGHLNVMTSSGRSFDEGKRGGRGQERKDMWGSIYAFQCCVLHLLVQRTFMSSSWFL